MSITVTKREDLAGKLIEVLRQRHGVNTVGPNMRLPGTRGYTLKEVTDGINKFVSGKNIKFPDFVEVFQQLEFDVSALNALPVTPKPTTQGNWFERTGTDPLYILCVALRLEGLQNPIVFTQIHLRAQDLKELFPFDDLMVKVTNKKVFFTYYYGEDCVTIPDENVEAFPSPEFLAVLRVAMDGCKAII